MSSCINKWYWLCCILTLVAALSIYHTWPGIYLKELKKNLELREGSPNYENWMKSPVPRITEFYLFNWTNPGQVYDKNSKPHFIETGPYVFEEKHFRTNVVFKSDEVIDFNRTVKWFFRKDLSQGSLEDVITNINPVLMVSCFRFRKLVTSETTTVVLPLLY